MFGTKSIHINICYLKTQTCPIPPELTSGQSNFSPVYTRYNRQQHILQFQKCCYLLPPQGKSLLLGKYKGQVSTLAYS